MHLMVPMMQALAKHVQQSSPCLTSCVRRQSASTNGFLTAVVVTKSASWPHIWQRNGGRVQTR
jgi:hypothetical protein